MFSKSRHLRGLKRGSGSSDDQYSELEPRAMSAQAANDHAATEPAANNRARSWPFTYALGLAVAISALLWAVIAAIIHYS